MKSRYMKPLRWPTNQEGHAYMNMRARQNREMSRSNPAEQWMARILAEQTSVQWTRQAQWGHRIFDFWCHKLGLAIEVDGKQHNHRYDAYRDEYNWRRSGIWVVRVPAFDERAAQHAVNCVQNCATWAQRRAQLGITRGYRNRRRWVSGQQELF
jgi:very-short-patch-repair endonuclease